MQVFLRSRTKFKRSGGNRACPICGKDGCGQGGGIVLCWRIEDGASGQAKSGAWVHRLDGVTVTAEYRPRFETPLAAIERRHAVYSAFLKALELNARHRLHLMNERRLSFPSITHAEFRSVPTRMIGDSLANRLALQWELKGVPGFWRKDGRWILRFAGMDGFYIPIRSHAGQIEALQIRTMNSDVKGKRYLLVSSDGLTDGVSSNAPAHFTRFQASELFITEGALKAEIIADQLKKPVVGLVAVGTFDESFGLKLKQQRPDARTVRIAFDSDWRTNEKVQKQMLRLSESLKRGGFAVKVERWEGAKGFDDYLLRAKR